MAALEEDSAPGAVDIGRVVRRAIETIAVHWFWITLAAIFLIAIPDVGWRLITDPNLPIYTPARSHWLNAGYIVISIVLTAIFQSWVVLIVVSEVNADSSGRMTLFRRAISLAWPIGVTAIVCWLGFIVGLIALIVPGLILGTAWAVAIPCIVVEGLGLRQALGRSASLTKNHRWAIFLLATIWFVAVLVTTLIAMKIASGGLSLKAASHVPLFAYSLSPAISVVFDVIAAIGLAAIYVELVKVKEAGLRSLVTEVFA